MYTLITNGGVEVDLFTHENGEPSITVFMRDQCGDLHGPVRICRGLDKIEELAINLMTRFIRLRAEEEEKSREKAKADKHSLFAD